ncbi:MAG: hypothetical protein II305_01675 [Clostridia bacterium]|nr:hypothetical protein [Clostridia bacterium]
MLSKNEKVNLNIVRVDVVDNDVSFTNERILETFYLINPDEQKLSFLKNKIETRFDESFDNKEEQLEDWWAFIYDFVRNNFKVLEVETKEIEW